MFFFLFASLFVHLLLKSSCYNNNCFVNKYQSFTYNALDFFWSSSSSSSITSLRKEKTKRNLEKKLVVMSFTQCKNLFLNFFERENQFIVVICEKLQFLFGYFSLSQFFFYVYFHHFKLDILINSLWSNNKIDRCLPKKFV